MARDEATSEYRRRALGDAAKAEGTRLAGVLEGETQRAIAANYEASRLSCEALISELHDELIMPVRALLFSRVAQCAVPRSYRAVGVKACNRVPQVLRGATATAISIVLDDADAVPSGAKQRRASSVPVDGEPSSAAAKHPAPNDDSNEFQVLERAWSALSARYAARRVFLVNRPLSVNITRPGQSVDIIHVLRGVCPVKEHVYCAVLPAQVRAARARAREGGRLGQGARRRFDAPVQ